ncbi:MAG: hypothetical protein PHS80_06955, partial [Methanothrix sp.]|nr:hypothetical protein [Methanothrix sp.]
DESKGRWPCVRSSIEYSDVAGPDAEARKISFCRELCCLFDRLQEGFDSLGWEEKARCGLDKVAFEISLQIDLENKKIVLDKLFKYADIDLHLFTQLLEILQRHFPNCDLVVPALQGYELAREIRKFLGAAEVECVFLKGDSEERLLMDEALRGISFEGILEDTQRHYDEQGGVEKTRQKLGRGWELPMYWRGREGEEAVLWMQVRIALSRYAKFSDN